MKPANFFANYHRGLRGCRFRIIGCLIFILFMLVGICSFLFWGISQIRADSASVAEPLSVYLLVDNSLSMFDLNGTGSDPTLLRIDAARLFISYLGVDDSRLAHECGVIFFGGEADVVVPLTRLNDDGRRAEMLALIQQPPRMKWTDHVQALELALANLPDKTADRRHALVLLTDGKPELQNGAESVDEVYVDRLRRLSKQMAAENIPLFIILLANETTDADADITDLWKPVWQEMALTTAPGRFYEARQAADLLAIYHDIAVALSGSRTAGPIIQGDVGAAGLRQTVPVETGLERLSLVISKSQPELDVAILLPDGALLSEGMPGARHAGQLGLTPEEVWAIDHPAAGDWTVLASGKGHVIVWKDYHPTPAQPTSAAPTPTALPVPIRTQQPESLPTDMATPMIQVKDMPGAVLLQQPVAIQAAVQNPPDSAFSLWLKIQNSTGFETELQLLDDGRLGDEEAGDGYYGGTFALATSGEYRVTLQMRQDSRLITQWEARLVGEAEPTLVISEIDGRFREGNRLYFNAEWQIGGEKVSPDNKLHFKSAVAYATEVDGTVTEVPLVPDNYGSFTGEVSLTQSGPISLTVSAAASTDLGQAVNKDTTAVLTVKPPYPYWIWLVAVILLGIGITTIGIRRWQRKRPVVTGSLRHLSGAGFVDSRPVQELDIIRRTQVTVGAAPADIPVKGTSNHFTIQLGQPLGDDYQMLIRGPRDIRVNGSRLGNGEFTLNDAAIITIGDTRLQYENLRLRQAQRRQSAKFAATNGWSPNPQTH